jgi:hypothetical protein
MRRLLARLLRISLITAAVVALVLFIYLSVSPSGDAAPHPFNHDRNATWLEHKWLEKTQTADDMAALFRGLHERGVQYLFPHIIPFDANGRLPPHDRQQLRAFLQTAREVAPQMRIVPWVGGLRVGYKRQRPGTIDLGNMLQRQMLVTECRGLIDEGFDGVHLNIEPIDNGNDDYIALLRALKAAIGEQAILSVSATRPGPFALPFAPNFLWTTGYYARVAAAADQLVVMAYDTALPTAMLYRRYLAYAARSTTTALPRDRTGARVLMGVPTYEARGIMHRKDVETLVGIVAGLRGIGGGGTFEGVALYAEWTTTDAEWSAYDRLWRGKRDQEITLPR